MAARISTFNDWIDLLQEWQHDIGLDRELIERFMPGYTFEAKYGELPTSEIFRRFQGRPPLGTGTRNPRPAYARRRP
jgi:hypothetical protein